MPSRRASRASAAICGTASMPPVAAAGLRVQRGERRIGRDQPAFGVEPAGDAVDVAARCSCRLGGRAGAGRDAGDGGAIAGIGAPQPEHLARPLAGSRLS